MSAKPITVRPKQRVESDLLRLADELDKSAGQFLADAGEAILAMVQADVPHVPRIVTAARTLRANKATFSDPERPFPQEDTRVLRVPRRSAGAEDGKRNPRKGDKPNGPGKVKT